MNSQQAELQKIEDVPIIDLQLFMGQDESSEMVQNLCKQVASSFHQFGVLIIKDPRAQQQDNSDYIDLMEKYFENRGKKLYAGEKLEDAKPECHYQVGVCPKEIEIARDHSQKIMNYSAENKPVSPLVPVFDAKWRFMWKIGERPQNSGDNFPQVIPRDFQEWESRLDRWGNKLLDGVKQVAQMAAIGMGLDRRTFSDKMDGGAHLLAPTGSDLLKNDVGAIFAGFHYDIAFLTIHGKARYPGLYVWTRNDTRLQVKVPEGCLLLQAGKTFEHITGGYVLAGFHEVIYTDQTKAVMEKAKAEGRSTWRVSSTMFTHFRFDTDCAPMQELVHLYSSESAAKYPQMTAFDILMTELDATNMVSSDKQSDTESSSPKSNDKQRDINSELALKDQQISEI